MLPKKTGDQNNPFKWLISMRLGIAVYYTIDSKKFPVRTACQCFPTFLRFVPLQYKNESDLIGIRCHESTPNRPLYFSKRANQ